jgi:hypothetical protein
VVTCGDEEENEHEHEEERHDDHCHHESAIDPPIEERAVPRQQEEQVR